MMETGKMKYGRFISNAFAVTMIFDDQDQPMSIAAIIRYETERFQEERNLKKKMAALENNTQA